MTKATKARPVQSPPPQILADLLDGPDPATVTSVSKEPAPEVEPPVAAKVGPEPAADLVVSPANYPTAVIGGISTEQLKAALEVQTEQRQLIKDFIMKHLEDGTDYGRIHVVSRDKCPDQYNCKKDYHYSKRVLFKPGQEKLFSLFQISDQLSRDEETYAMLPDLRNLVAYKCVMFRNGEKLGEGRGSATVGDKGRDPNATIKIAEKRARMDACLSLGFSEYFAQDLDDPDYKSQADMANQRVAAQADAADVDEFGLFPRDAELPISDDERKVLFKLTLTAGFEKNEMRELLKANGINPDDGITSGEARTLMAKLKNNVFAAPDIKRDPVDMDVDSDPAIGLGAAIADMAKSPPIAEEELVVDDDLKVHVQEDFASIGFNNRGTLWFMKFVSGKPYGTFEKFEDDHWRKAYDVVQDILDVRMEVDDDYLRSIAGGQGK